MVRAEPVSRSRADGLALQRLGSVEVPGVAQAVGQVDRAGQGQRVVVAQPAAACGRSVSSASASASGEPAEAAQVAREVVGGDEGVRVILAQAGLVRGLDLGHQLQRPGHVVDRRVVAGQVERAGLGVGRVAAVTALVPLVGVLGQVHRLGLLAGLARARPPGSWRCAAVSIMSSPSTSRYLSQGVAQQVDRLPERARRAHVARQAGRGEQGVGVLGGRARCRCRSSVSSSRRRAAKQSPTSR